MKKNDYEKLNLNNKFYKRYRNFTPILNEYFSRMKADMNLNDDELNYKADLLLENVKGIKFGVMPKAFKGCFIPSKQKIVLTASIFNFSYDYEQLLNIITHELDHACAYDIKNKNIGLYRYDQNSKTKSNPNDIFFDELKTDIGSTRRVFNNNYIDTENIIRKTYAYKNFSPFSTVLQNCLGVTEYEFLTLASKGRASFDREMEKKFVHPKDYHIFMDKFAINASLMLNMKTKMIEENRENFSNAFNEIKDLSYVALNLRMQKDIIDNPDIELDSYIKNIICITYENEKNFDYAEKEFRVDDIVKRLMEKLSLNKNLTFEDIDIYNNELDKNKKESEKFLPKEVFENKLVCMELLLQNKNNLEDKFKEAAYNIAAAGNVIKLEEYLNKDLNIDFKKVNQLELKNRLDPKSFKERKLQKDNIHLWDNTNIYNDIDIFINTEKNKKINKFKAKIMQNIYKEPVLERVKTATDKNMDFKQEVKGLVKDMRTVVKEQIQNDNMVNINKKTKGEKTEKADIENR